MIMLFKEKISILKNTEFIIICLLFCLLFASCSAAHKVLPQHIETVKSLDERTFLSYDWRVYPGDNPDIALPEYDDSSWESINFPVINYSFDIKKSNFFWFRKTFNVSINLKGKSLGYSCGKLPQSTQVYFNGALIGTSGSMPPKNYFPRSIFPRSFLLPDKLVNFGGKNVLAYRVYTELEYGDLKLGYITTNEDRLNTYFYQYAINQLIPMIIVFFSGLVAAYFFLMYIRNRKEHFNLYLCLALLFIALYSTLYFIEYIPVHILIPLKIWYISLFLAILFFIFYFQSFYNIHTNRNIRLIFIGVVFICSIILIFVQTVEQLYDLVFGIYYLFIIGPMILYLGFLSIYAIIKKNQYAKVLSVGIFLIIGTSLHDMLYTSLQIEPVIWLANTGFVFYILSLFLTNANRFVDTKKEVDKLNIELTQQKDAFFRFVPTQFLSLLGKQSAVDIKLGDSSEKSMSVLFSDIRKFTTISELKSPDENFHLLNEYLIKMESPISENEGFVDKYIGDAIMALFSEGNGYGEAMKDKTSADRAILAAIGMRQQLDEFNKSQAFKHLDILNIGIGINTGSLMLGTVGGTHRMDTTVIGDSVNIASRLEKLTHFYRTSIIISEWTYNTLSDPQAFAIREIDLVIVRGKTESCKIYEVFEADPENIKELKLRTIDIIHTGIKKYKDRKFKDALTYFKEAKSVYPKDIIPLLYIKRCVAYGKNPPPPNWSGVFRVQTDIE